MDDTPLTVKPDRTNLSSSSADSAPIDASANVAGPDGSGKTEGRLTKPKEMDRMQEIGIPIEKSGDHVGNSRTNPARKQTPDARAEDVSESDIDEDPAPPPGLVEQFWIGYGNSPSEITTPRGANLPTFLIKVYPNGAGIEVNRSGLYYGQVDFD